MSYNYKFNASDVGLRIKNARAAKGWSQAELAEKVETTSQNISKFEKNGLSDMNWIATIGNVLDVDLLENTIDVEGSVGEIGREILFQLVRNNGSCEMDELIGHYLYGLSSSQVTEEIVKLSKIGLIIRELYKDFDDDEMDTIFIRTKGVIALKNMQLTTMQSIEIESKLSWKYETDEFGDTTEIPPAVVPYEKVIGNFKCYEDYINYHKENDVEIKLRELDVFPTSDDFNLYRSFFINYLKKNYQEDYEVEYDWLKLPIDRGFFGECLSRMIFKVTDDVIRNHLETEETRSDANRAVFEILTAHNPLLDPVEEQVDYSYWMWDESEYLSSRWDDEDDEDFNPMQDEYDEYIMNLDVYRNKYGISETDPSVIIQNADGILSKIDDENAKEYFRNLVDAWPIVAEWRDARMSDEPKHEEVEFYDYKKYKEETTLHNEERPSMWFKKEDFIRFIEENFKPAKTEEEKAVDEKLREIIAIKPNALDYFQFPASWEQNGLADLVRNNSGLF